MKNVEEYVENWWESLRSLQKPNKRHTWDCQIINWDTKGIFLEDWCFHDTFQIAQFQNDSVLKIFPVTSHCFYVDFSFTCSFLAAFQQDKHSAPHILQVYLMPIDPTTHTQHVHTVILLVSPVSFFFPE